jgi:hypothetical protein
MIMSGVSALVGIRWSSSVPEDRLPTPTRAVVPASRRSMTEMDS